MRSVRGNACCKPPFGRFTDQAFRVPASIQFSPPPTSPRERSITTSRERSPRLCRRRRENRKTYARQVVASYAERGGSHRHFDRRCPAHTRSAPRCPRRLSAAPFVTGDVSAGRAIPQATEEDIP